MSTQKININNIKPLTDILCDSPEIAKSLMKRLLEADYKNVGSSFINLDNKTPIIRICVSKCFFVSAFRSHKDIIGNTNINANEIE